MLDWRSIVISNHGELKALDRELTLLPQTITLGSNSVLCVKNSINCNSNTTIQIIGKDGNQATDADNNQLYTLHSDSSVLTTDAKSTVVTNTIIHPPCVTASIDINTGIWSYVQSCDDSSAPLYYDVDVTLLQQSDSGICTTDNSGENVYPVIVQDSSDPPNFVQLLDQDTCIGLYYIQMPDVTTYKTVDETEEVDNDAYYNISAKMIIGIKDSTTKLGTCNISRIIDSGTLIAY